MTTQTDMVEDEPGDTVRFAGPLFAIGIGTGISAVGAFRTGADEIVGNLSGEWAGVVLGGGAVLCFVVALRDFLTHR